jgi:hypothetical protein
MMAGLNVIFLAVLCGIMYGIFLGAWTAALYVFRIKRKFRFALVSLPIFIAGWGLLPLRSGMAGPASTNAAPPNWWQPPPTA